MSQLEAINDIAANIPNVKITKNLTVAGSLAYINDHAEYLTEFQYLDDLSAALARDEATKGVRAISFHMENVRNELARELWQRGLGVGLYTLG